MKAANHANNIEVLGRNHLVAQLIQDDVHAAIPLWDQGLDLIAYFNDGRGLCTRGIQLKANEGARFGLHRKYDGVAGLLMVYVWHVKESRSVEIYAMTYHEAFAILEERGHTLTESWNKPNGGYSIPNVQGKLLDRLQPYRMLPGMWQERMKLL
jgi:hypothetical protein